MALSALACGPALAGSIQRHAQQGCTMINKTSLASLAASLVLLAASGCAVSRGQETMGAYVDDAGITTLVKSRFFEDKDVAGTSISVETLNGTVMLSGFAKSALERNKAETIARGVKGVTSVKNEIAIRP
jgi:hyperosmotically inducible periplasmic protein